MPAIHDLMSAAKDASGIPSNYRLAHVLGVTVHTVANWQNDRALPNEAMTIRLAELAGVDPAPYLAEMAAGRAKDDETRGMWLAIADRLRKAPMMASAAFTLAASFAAAPAPSQAMESGFDADSVRYVNRRRKEKVLRASLVKAIRKAHAH